VKKIVKGIGLTVLVLTILCACGQTRYDESNISRMYSREWIVGRSESEIQAKYGPFDRIYTLDSGEDVGAYYVNSYDANWLDPNNIHDTYFVVFDEERVAVDAYFRQTSRGG